jgi:outer membrane protein assembly factor BamD (BamD/ComL family)
MREGMIMNRVATGFVLGTGLLLAACNFAESDWQEAQHTNTEAAYQTFIRDHPDSEHVKDARDGIQTLKDEQAWAKAHASTTLPGSQAH